MRTLLRETVELRWGMPFWTLLNDFAEQGLTVAKTAKALGCNYATLYAILRKNPQSNPFPQKRSKPVEYTIDTGEPFKVAVLRLAETHTQHAASVALGYNNQWHFQRDLKRYGIEAEFRPRGVQFTFDGITATPMQHARRLGMSQRTVYYRMRQWGLCSMVFTEPLHHIGSRASDK